MTATAVIPVKGLGDVKRRLSSRLGRAERAALVLRLVARELDVLTASPSIDEIIVVTSDDRVKALSEMQGARVTLQPDNGVNAAIAAGLQEAYEIGAEKVLAIHGDLPFVNVADINAIVGASEPGTFVIAPDRGRMGTNAIVMRRSTPVPLHFGIGSFARHVSAAAAAGQTVHDVERRGLGFDLDTPSDLLEYRKRFRTRQARA